MKYKDLYQNSINDKSSFWKEQATLLDWFQFPTNIINETEENIFSWYADGITNMSYLCLDYHIKNGRGDQFALIYDSPVTNTIKKYTYNQLLQEVEAFAGAAIYS